MRLLIRNFCCLLETITGAGANGRTGKEWKKLLPYLRSRLDADCNVSFLFDLLIISIFLHLVMYLLGPVTNATTSSYEFESTV